MDDAKEEYSGDAHAGSVRYYVAQASCLRVTDILVPVNSDAEQGCSGHSHAGSIRYVASAFCERGGAKKLWNP